jgi:DNA-binding response OmpR family regulator
VSEAKPVILIVEDDVDVADMLNAYFNVQGYDVSTANWGEDAIRSCQTKLPDLVILDIRLPDIDGFEVARRLRSIRRTKEVPIIFLTEKRARGDRLQGLEVGADDYLTKPFDVQELRLRVRNALRRSAQGSLTNPVTNLPEGPLVEERLRECLNQTGWAILVISLKNLEKFRESYGFVASDDVQKAIGLMIRNAVHEMGNSNDFVGQLGPTDFLLVTTPNVLQNLSQRIRTRMDQALDYFYPLKDREQDKPGKHRMSIRLSQLLSTQGPFNTVNQITNNLLS